MNFDFVIAHRGASEYAPENTRAAFELAAKLGATWVELDLHLTRDKRIVIIHDAKVDKCTNGKGCVANMDYADIAKLDAGSWFSSEFEGQRILTLEELIQIVTNLNLHANLELKPLPETEDDLVRITAEILTSHWPKTKDAPLISSFSMTTLEKFKKLMPELPIATLFDEWDTEKNLSWIERLNPVAVNLSDDIADKKSIEILKSLEKKIFVYTINSAKKALQLCSLGVNGVFTNCPDKIMNALNKK
jgi:glycerophosphoryl diester phosphodiesterase